MPRNLPRTLPDLRSWSRAHADEWQAHQADIGVSALQVAAFAALADELDAKAQAAEAARLASQCATRALHQATAALRKTGGAMVNQIKAFAEVMNKPGVYSLAGLSAGDGPGTAPAPQAPTDFSAQLNSDGSVTLRWKARQPKGATLVQYRVSRRLGGEQTFTLIGTVGSVKRYTDPAIPAGTASVAYLVEPVRGDTVGPAGNTFSLQFGSPGAGVRFSSTAENAAVKMAA